MDLNESEIDLIESEIDLNETKILRGFTRVLQVARVMALIRDDAIFLSSLPSLTVCYITLALHFDLTPKRGLVIRTV